jgi:hypothetical protein
VKDVTIVCFLYTADVARVIGLYRVLGVTRKKLSFLGYFQEEEFSERFILQSFGVHLIVQGNLS